jgi:light-regulated signal transduction histidine kinase (bacteriophytochrome)
MTPGRRVDLQSCADEPIHVPGSIQPHGALLFFDQAGQLEGWSANAPALLGLELELASPGASLALPAATLELLAEARAGIVDGYAPPAVAAVSLGAAQYDCIVHAAEGRIVAEFEQRDVPADEVALFAIKAHSSIDRLRRQKSLDALLETAVQQVRAITGFDRVMAYRFRQDDSGDVVAESLREGLAPYLGQRYPAGDIPAQARRLYVLNTLRLIADINYQGVPLLGAPGAAPLDMSHAVLRSVSPVHIEYLQNMGVGASMSVSIVINGRLWGLLACHHMAAKRVPYAIRMAADVLAQVIASTIQTIETQGNALLVEKSATVRARVVDSLLLEDDPLDAFMHHADATLESAHAQAVLCVQQGKIAIHGDVPIETAEAIVRALPAHATDVVQRDKQDDWPPEVRPLLGKWAGMLALPFDPPTGAWCVVLRVEQVEQVAWAGRPDKQTEVGPLGPRLTPRGSFDAWSETVRGHAQPWEPTILANARLTLAALVRASNARRAQTDATRAELLAMLGHDLRDPLHSINMAGSVLEHGHDAPAIGRRIKSSSSRMQRMISQVLDISRIDGGLGLGIALEPLDLGELVEDLLDEARLAYPGIRYELDSVGAVLVRADSARLAQVLSNLLSNARHHGRAGEAIRVRVAAEEAEALVEVSNPGEPIAPDAVPALFNPFKRTSLGNPRNRSGMGLGLYIAQQIVREHHGEIGYRHDGQRVVFVVRLPLLAGPAGT